MTTETNPLPEIENYLEGDEPIPGVEQEELNEWFLLVPELKRLKAREMELRKSLFNGAFPFPTEGTNTFNLEGGYKLKGTYKLERSVDTAAFQALSTEMKEADIAADGMLRFKASLIASEYKRLTDEQRHLFDQCIIIKPGSPSLEIIPPKKKAD